MNSITPVDSQVSSRSFSIRCSVFLRSDALPGKPRSVATLTPYSSVGRDADTELGREVVGEVLDDERVGAERQVPPVLLAGPDRDDQPRIGPDGGADLVRPHLLDAARRPRRSGGVGHPGDVLEAIAAGRRARGRWSRRRPSAAASLAASGWLAEPRVGYLAACFLATAIAAVATWRLSPRALRVPLGLACVALAVLCRHGRSRAAAARQLLGGSGRRRRDAGCRAARGARRPRRRRARDASPDRRARARAARRHPGELTVAARAA